MQVGGIMGRSSIQQDEVRCRSRLGGLLNFYYREAA